MIKAVIFDIDNTLYSYDDAHAVAWEALCAYALEQLGMDRERFSRQVDAAAKAVSRRLGNPCGALHSRLLRCQVLLEENRLPLRHAGPMNELYWNTLIAAAKPEPGILECLRSLKDAGLILGIGTDMTVDFQLKKLEKLGLIDLFDFLVSSEEVNAEKPDPKLFLACAEKAGVRPEECLFIGDSLKKDVAGPAAVGMRSLWYAPDPGRGGDVPEENRITRFALLPHRILSTQ